MAPRPYSAPNTNAAFISDGNTMTHSVFSKRSCGMPSGMLSTSCMTTPLSSRRLCALFKSWADTTPATRVRHAAATRYFFITDLHGRKFRCQRLIFLECLVEGSSRQFESGEGYALPDSQAGQCVVYSN